MTRSPSAQRCCAAFILALSSSACAGVPLAAPVMPTTPTLRHVASIDAAAIPDAAWPADGWWRRYGDAQLDRLIEEALADAPDLQSAAARVRAADSLARIAGSALQPHATAGAMAGETRLSKNDGIPAAIVPGGWNDTATVGLGLSFDLDLWGRNRAALRAARLDAKAAHYEALEVRLLLSTNIARSYAELAALHAQRDTLEQAVAIRRQTLALVDQRFARGLDTDAVQHQAKGRLEATLADLSATDEAIALCRNALAALVGNGPDRALTIVSPALDTLHVQDLPAGAAIGLIGRRPDVAAARARVDAASQRIKQARAAFYPDINLTALAGFQSFGFAQLLKGSSSIGTVGPAISLPLFEGGALKGQLGARRGQYDEAVAQYDATLNAALHETADALTSRQMLAARLDQSTRALADFEAANRLARARYAQGLSTYLDVLSAEEGVLDQRLTVARLQTRAFALDIALVRALGGGFHA